MAHISRVESQLLPTSPLGLAWGLDEPLADAVHALVRRHRRHADGTSLAAALARIARLDIAAGRWGAAEDAAAEGLASAERIGAEHIAAECRNCLGWLAAARGDGRSVDHLTVRTLQLAGPRRDRAVSASAHWNRGMAALAAGRADAALDLLARLDEHGHEAAHPIVALLASLDTIEAAVHARRPEIGQRRAEALDAWVRRTGAHWARFTAQRTWHAHCWTNPPPNGPTGRRWTCPVRPGARSTTHGPVCSTASGCGDSGGAETPASSSTPLPRRSTHWERTRCSSGPGVSSV
ncbi:hypothetical protein [Streptomyces sp. NBC_01012]|uniref:Uncharacterized protein n=1 Tax=Streptomyces sp. NBC_01401 TaxID=2903854 RepID=A0AAU3GNL7_9ACTN|nr:hypothetical protein OG623_06530 [Streptomyces sp. NBC_01012]